MQMSMIGRNFLLLAAVIAMAASCSSDRGDPLPTGVNEFGGQLNQGAGRANLTVGEDNMYQVWQIVADKLLEAFEKSLLPLSSSQDAGSTGVVRMQARYYGYAEVSGSTTVGPNNRLSFNVDLNFYNYSDSGDMFFGGRVNYLGRLTGAGSTVTVDSLVLGGGMAFAGDYQGSVSFDSLFVPMAGNGRPVITVNRTYCDLASVHVIGELVFKSGSNTLRFNPWYRMPIPCG